MHPIFLWATQGLRWQSAVIGTLLLSIGMLARAADCEHGLRSTLTTHMEDMPRIPRMSQGMGRTVLVLKAQADRATAVELHEEGRWSCIGFDKVIDAYVVAGVFQVGAWLPIGAIRYLREDGSWLDSAFDRAQHVALAVVVSPSARFVVYVGGAASADGLYALDVETDTVRKLGSPPAPPPVSAAGITSLCRGERFAWGSCWADGLVEMDSGVIWFDSDHEIAVSYGRDTQHGRAKRRSLRRFDLN